MFQEVTKLRETNDKQKKKVGSLEEKLNNVLGVKRFDASMAFKHREKENLPQVGKTDLHFTSTKTTSNRLS